MTRRQIMLCAAAALVVAPGRPWLERSRLAFLYDLPDEILCKIKFWSAFGPGMVISWDSNNPLTMADWRQFVALMPRFRIVRDQVTATARWLDLGPPEVGGV